MKRTLILVALIATVFAIPHRQHSHESDFATNAVDVTANPAQTSIADNTADADAATATSNDVRSRSRGGQRSSTVVAASRTVEATATAEATRAGTRTTTVAGNRAGSSTSTPSAKSGSSGSIDPSLVPDFGQQAGLQPDGTGNCKTDTGKTIPCQCPPDRSAFIAKLEEFVNAGSFFGLLAAPFPTSNSNQDALTRINTIISTLQNFDGSSGKGCPAISAPNFSTVQCKLLKGDAGACGN